MDLRMYEPGRISRSIDSHVLRCYSLCEYLIKDLKLLDLLE